MGSCHDREGLKIVCERNLGVRTKVKAIDECSALLEIEASRETIEDARKHFTVKEGVPFSEEDAKDYIKHRLKVAGCSKEIFAEEAIKRIYQYTQGIPRRINTVCDNALLEGYLFKAN